MKLGETVRMNVISPGVERILFGKIRSRDLITVFAGGFAAVIAQRVFSVANGHLMAVTSGHEAPAASPNMAIVFLIASALFALIIAIGRAKPSRGVKSSEQSLPDPIRRVKIISKSNFARS